jgi:hypothetical protein
MNYDLLIFLLCTEFSIIVGLFILLSRKQKIITKYEDKKREQKLHYYSLKSSLDIHKKQVQSISDYNAKLESMNRQKENLISSQKKILQQKENLLMQEKYIEKTYAVDRNIILLEKCNKIMAKTKDINILQAEYESGLEVIRWFIKEEALFPEAPYLLKYGSERFLDDFRDQFNDAIIRITSNHLIKYKQKFYELYTSKARQAHTQRMFIELDTLREMIDIQAHNFQSTFEALKEYHDQVENMFSGIYNTID